MINNNCEEAHSSVLVTGKCYAARMRLNYWSEQGMLWVSFAGIEMEAGVLDLLMVNNR